MNYLKLQAFCLLVKHKKLAPVATALSITAPTVSFHIRSIEEEYEIKLFRTNPGGYRLTDAGEGFLHYAQRIVQLHKDMDLFLKNSKLGNIGAIRLGASGLPAHIYMPDLIHLISDAYPGIKISLEVKTAPEIEKKLALQELDFGIIMETKQELANLSYETIGEDMLVLALSPNHVLASKKDITKDSVLNTKLLLHSQSSSTNYFIRKWLEPIPASLQTIELDSISTIKKMLTFGETAAFLSATLIEDELLSGRLVKKHLTEMNMSRKIQLVYPTSHLPGKLDHFVKLTVRSLAFHPAK